METDVINFDVKNRVSGAVQFTAEIEASEEELYGVKLGLAVIWAVKNGANLSGASGVNNYVKCIQIEQYPITYTADILQIGCDRHAISDWANFDDHRIAKMDGKSALKFWRKYKAWIFQTIELCPAKPTEYVKEDETL